MLRQRGRVGLMAAALVGLVVGGAQAQVTTERSASILVFPKVIADGTRDTIIQITNTGNSVAYAHCFYVNGALTFPDLPPGPINPPLWTEVDFDITLTKQQPTHWVVSQGRLVDPTDPPCSNATSTFDCNGAGIDPGRVPPVVESFTGELKCIETDGTGAPVSGNHLKGEATTIYNNVCDPDDSECFISGTDCSSTECEKIFDASKYNAIGILGNENNNGDNVLCLGGQPDGALCPNGAEYDACPQFWIANHFAEDAPDPVAPGDSEVDVSWTFVPCTENFETQNPTTVTIAIDTWNEFEQPFSSSTTVTCWAELKLDDINPVTFSYDTLGTTFAQTRLRPSALTQSGFLMVGSERHETDDDYSSWADVNFHIEGARPGPDLITIPAEQVGVGAGPTP